jgi:hypothetical protein
VGSAASRQWHSTARSLFRLVGSTHGAATAIRTPLRGPVGQAVLPVRASTALVSVLVSVVIVRGRSRTYSPPSEHAQRTSTNVRERAGAKLESGLGSRPREFESRILRGSDKGKRAFAVRCRMVRTCRSLSPRLTCGWFGPCSGTGANVDERWGTLHGQISGWRTLQKRVGFRPLDPHPGLSILCS